MKSTIASIAITLAALFAGAPGAEAGSYHSSHVYISGYQSCGTPIYRERYLVGHDHCGRPIWGTRIVYHSPRPVVRPRYVEPCRPVYRSNRDRGYAPRVEFRASYGRW